jgi:hypothetical protein
LSTAAARDRRKKNAFFHVLSFFIAKKRVLSKKIKFLRVKSKLSLIYFIYAESKNINAKPKKIKGNQILKLRKSSSSEPTTLLTFTLLFQ